MAESSATTLAGGMRGQTDLTYKDVIRITTNPPAQRSRKDITAVCDWIQKVTPLFADIDKDIVYNVMRSCKCQILVRDTVVVKQGERGNAFYIILRGQVSVFVAEESRKSLLRELLESDDEAEKSPTPEEITSARNSETEEEIPKVSLPSVRQRFRKSLTKLKITQVITPKMKKVVKKPDPREKLGLKVAQMNDGKSFGELALQNSNNRREASCVTDTETVFLVVPRELYNKSIRSYQAKQMALVKGFISEHPLFTHWPSKLQAQVQNSVVQLKVQAGAPIIHQGQTCNGIYFLVQGEVKVILNAQNHCKQYITKWTGTGSAADATSKLEDAKPEQRMLGRSEILRALSVPHVHVKRRGGYHAAELYQNNKQRNLCLSGPTIMFGDIEHILGVGTYMQTVTAEGPVKILHINKENLSRLLRLANAAGQVVSAPTLTAMTEIAYETWVNRIEKFATPTDDFSCLDQMVNDLSKHPTKRSASAEQVAQSKEERIFEALMKAYVNNQAPLIQPCVEGGYAYREAMQEKAELRKRQREKQAKRNNTKVQKSLRPIQNTNKPRSIAALKEQIRKYQTSDANIIVPPRRRTAELEPLQETAKMKNNKYKADSKMPISSAGHLTTVNQEPRLFDGLSSSLEPAVNTHAKRGGNPNNAWEKSGGNEPLTRKGIDANNDGVILSYSPGVLVTEVTPQHQTYHKCEPLKLVEGKTLKFYSQYLRGRLEKEFEKDDVEPEVYLNNREAELLEQKLQLFIDPNKSPLEGKTMICKLRRLDETKKLNILPGGKCIVERMPCRLLHKSFPLKAHQHIRRHMVAHSHE